jgi:hypothetical protein
MTLDDELRAVLYQEADSQVTTGPDVHMLIAGGQVRRRRRTVTRAVVSGLALAIVGSGAYAVTQVRSETGGSGLADQRTETPEPTGAAAPPPFAEDPGSEDLAPGTYRLLVASLPAAPDIQADLIVEGSGWRAGDYPVLEDATSFGGIGVYRPWALAEGTGCVDDETLVPVAEAPQALAQQLTELPRSTVVQPVTRTEILGRTALHLRLRIAQDCPLPEYYRVADTPRGSRGITYEKPGELSPPVVIDFWVLDYEGTAIIVDSWHWTGASSDLVDRIADVRDSITVVTGS